MQRLSKTTEGRSPVLPKATAFLIALALMSVEATYSVQDAPNPSPSAVTARPAPRPVTLFKVEYGDKPHQLRARFGKSYGEGDFSPGGGPSAFYVTPDGQRFYFIDFARLLTKEFHEPDEEALQDPNSPYKPWIQVYDRQGRHVRTIRLAQNGLNLRLRRLRVDAQGRLYFPDRKNYIAIYNEDGTYEEERSRRVSQAIRSVLEEHEMRWFDLYDVDNAGRIYCLAEKTYPSDDPRFDTIEDIHVLVVNTDNQVKVLWNGSGSDCAVNRQSGEVIVFDPDYDGMVFADVQVSYRNWRWNQPQPDEVDSTGEHAAPLRSRYLRVRPDGEVVSQFLWDTDVSTYGLNLWADSTIAMVGNHAFFYVDSSGRLYYPYTANTRHRKEVADRSDPDCVMRKIDGSWILEFSPDGRFQRVRAENICLSVYYGGSRFGGQRMYDLWYVDLQGNVYWLDFQPDHIAVMMSPVR